MPYVPTGIIHHIGRTKSQGHPFKFQQNVNLAGVTFMNFFSKTAVLLTLTLSPGFAAQAGEGSVAALFAAKGPGPEISICLTSVEGENKLVGEQSSSKLAALTIGFHKDATTDNSGSFEANMKLRFTDSKQNYSMVMICDPASSEGGGLSCWVPCGDGVSLDLSAMDDNKVEVKINVSSANFKNTEGTGDQTETLQMAPVDMKVCKPDSV